MKVPLPHPAVLHQPGGAAAAGSAVDALALVLVSPHCCCCCFLQAPTPAVRLCCSVAAAVGVTPSWQLLLA